MSIRISIDPGFSTGLAVWSDGRCVELSTIKVPARGEDWQRYKVYMDRLGAFFLRWAEDGILAVAVENFGTFRATGKLMKCATVRGICIGMAYAWTKEVIDISKGTSSKIEADLHTMAAGFSINETTEHERDALHLGICAGFDRRPS